MAIPPPMAFPGGGGFNEAGPSGPQSGQPIQSSWFQQNAPGGAQTGGDLQAKIKELMGQGLWGQQLTDALKAAGFQDNGLYYGGNNTVGFGNFYVTPDGSVVPRGPEAGGGSAYGGGQGMPLQQQLGLNPGYGIFQNLNGGMTPQQILQGNPGYQFAVDQGNQGIQRSAAAKGTLLTGGTLKDLAQFNTGLASQNYNNIFGQQLGLAGLGSNIYNSQVQNNQNLAQLGKPS